ERARGGREPGEGQLLAPPDHSPAAKGVHPHLDPTTDDPADLDDARGSPFGISRWGPRGDAHRVLEADRAERRAAGEPGPVAQPGRRRVEVDAGERDERALPVEVPDPFPGLRRGQVGLDPDQELAHASVGRSPRRKAACPMCWVSSLTTLTSRTPRVTGGSQEVSTTQSRSVPDVRPPTHETVWAWTSST